MAEFNSQDAAERYLDQTPMAPPSMPQMPMPGAADTPYVPPEPVTPGPPDVGVGPVEATPREGFDDDFAFGYGHRPAAAAEVMPPVGTPEWIAKVRTWRATDDPRLQQLIADHPDQFTQIMQALAPGADVPPAAPTPVDAVTEQLAPVTDPVDDDPADDVDPMLAQQGLNGWLNRYLRMSRPKSRRETTNDLMEYAAHLIRTAIDSGQSIVIGVTSYKGGSGKTRVAVAAGKIIAEIIEDYLADLESQTSVRPRWRAPVLAMDVDLHGMLQPCSVDSAEIRTDIGVMTTLCSRLANGYAPEQIDIAKYTHDAGGGYHFIAGNHFGQAASITPDGYLAALDLVKAQYPVVIVDRSQVVATELHATVLRSLDGLLMITPPDEAEANFLDGTRHLLSSRPGGVHAEHLIQQRVTVINHNKPWIFESRSFNSDSVAARLKLHEAGSTESANPRGSDVAEVPWDWHIASERLITVDRLRPRTRIGVQLAIGALYDTILNPTGRE